MSHVTWTPLSRSKGHRERGHIVAATRLQLVIYYYYYFNFSIHRVWTAANADIAISLLVC